MLLMLDKFYKNRALIRILCSGDVRGVPGVGRGLSIGQVMWGPSIGDEQYLVFVGWPSDTRKFGVKYCSNRACALYAIKCPVFNNDAEDLLLVKLTQSISSALYPHFRYVIF